MIFKDKNIIYELKTIESKLDQLIAIKKAERMKTATKLNGKEDK
jgi:hypothetical protein